MALIWVIGGDGFIRQNLFRFCLHHHGKSIWWIETCCIFEPRAIAHEYEESLILQTLHNLRIARAFNIYQLRVIINKLPKNKSKRVIISRLDCFEEPHWDGFFITIKKCIIALKKSSLLLVGLNYLNSQLVSVIRGGKIWAEP